MARFLVLGGTAWLGREVAEEAVRAGHEVTVLARGESGPAPTGVRVVRADRSRPGAYAEVGGEWDVVVDVSRQPSHVRGAVAALGPRTGTWVFVSSCSVYAGHDQPGADESAPLLPPSETDEDGFETYGERKVACEQHVLAALPDRALVARAGLIGGPGDVSDRTGYWPLRFAHPATTDGSVLVPDSTVTTQLVDARDLAAWLVRAGAQGANGVVNASGPTLPLAEHLAAARRVAGHEGELVAVPQEWLAEHSVAPWSGERSLPMWLPVPEYAGFMARDTSAAQALGLVTRPLEDTLEDVLEWELRQGPGRPRRAGLSPSEERELLAGARGDQGLP
ncbi:MAG TPA: oxidoreductase [Pedococcus sp.]|nr:oxidoreductase [Pedococcus sp.]